MTQGIPIRVGQTVDTVALGASRFVQGVTGFEADLQFKVLLSCVVVLGVMLLRRVILHVTDRRFEDVRVRYRWAKVTGYVAFLVAFFVVVNIWVGAVRSLGTFLGLLTAGLAIALKDLVANLAGWLFVIWRRPFDLGDRIQIGDHSGDVVDIRIFQFSLLEIGNWVDADQSTGRIIHMPNQKVFTEPLANYTPQFEYLWNEVPVLITFESDWRRAKAILEAIAVNEAGGLAHEAEQAMRRASRRSLILYQKLTPVVYTSVKDSGILLTIRFLCKARQRRGTQQSIWESVLESFGRESAIDLAYPTQRVFMNSLEGKKGARADLPAFTVPGTSPEP